MPELPEVTITAEKLHALSKRGILTKVKIHRNIKSNFNYDISRINDKLPLKIRSVRNRSKNIYFNLIDEQSQTKWMVINHMRLEGWWSIQKNRNLCVTFTVQYNNDVVKLYYHDNMGIGTMDFMKSKHGYDILNEIKSSVFDGLTKDEFIKGMRLKNRSMIFSVIMNQNAVIGGVGNYIANDALYRARIAPRSMIKNIDNKHLGKLYKIIKFICYDSYEHSCKLAQEGKWYKGYNKKLLVYGKKTDPNGYKVINDKVAGRTTHWVKEIQIL